MSEKFDVIVIGMGPGGEVAADRLRKAGKPVAAIERELIGGECGYWACIPSKTLLRPYEARSEAGRSAGVRTPEVDWNGVAAYRDYMIRHLDDSKQVEGYEKQGVTVIKGSGRLTGPGQVEAKGRSLQAEHIIIATGSDPVVPPIEGLDQGRYWTNREATTLKEVPRRVLVIGGGPVGIELGQLLRRAGAQVTIVELADRLLEREDPRASELITGFLQAEGIDVRVHRQVKRVQQSGDGSAIELDDGTGLTVDVVVVGAGRSPRLTGLGLETVGVRPQKTGIAVDEHCRVVEGLWAIGDVTGVMPFTHVAKYQARVAADNILGKQRTADYRGIPRVVFSDPEIAAVGLHPEEAKRQGLDPETARIDLPAALARPWTYERDPRGELGLVADRRRGVLIGAWSVAPMAGEWIHLASLAIRAEIPLEKLADSAPQFPTYSEAYVTALERLTV